MGRDFAGEFHLVGHEDHGAAFVGEIRDDLEHLADQFGVKRRGRLVEQHDARLDGQRAGDGARCCWPPDMKAG